MANVNGNLPGRQPAPRARMRHRHRCGRTLEPWGVACPVCRSALHVECSGATCAQCKRDYPCSSGIWRFLPKERMTHYERFLGEYRIVREHQGWGQPNADYFRALPTVARGDAHREIWRRRRESLGLLLEKVIAPMGARRAGPLRIADLGAGNCWLAYRRSKEGHKRLRLEELCMPIFLPTSRSVTRQRTLLCNSARCGLHF